MPNRSALIVEDDSQLCEIFAELFEYANMQVERTEDGQIALDMLARLTPDVIMLDIHLPHVSGLEILKWVRGEPRLAHTKIVAITANTLLKDTLKEQADYVIIKPPDFDHLDALMREIAE